MTAIGTDRYGIGQPVRRTEDPRLLTGRGTYTDDLDRPDLPHMAVVRSPHAHARILRVDATAARAAPGVRLVLTGADAPWCMNRAGDRLGIG